MESAMAKLVKADELLAQQLIEDAENAEVKCAKYQKYVDRWIDKAKDQMTNAEDDLEKGKHIQTIMHYKYEMNKPASEFINIILYVKFSGFSH